MSEQVLGHEYPADCWLVVPQFDGVAVCLECGGLFFTSESAVK